MKKLMYSLRTTLTIAIGLMLVISIGTVSWISLRTTQDAYLNLALRDVEYMADQMAAGLGPVAAQSSSQADFGRNGAPAVKHMTDQYFEKYGMTGYAIIVATDGTFLFHPKVEKGSLADSEQGTQLLVKAKGMNFNGTVFYDWKNPGEHQPRTKFAVFRPVPGKPDLAIAITAYTEDDLLLPFRAASNQAVLIGAGIVLAALVMTVFLAGSFTAFIRKLQGVTARVARGDLRTDHADLAVLVRRKDELGDMARNMHDMIFHLREILGEVTEGTRTLLTASNGMAASSQVVASAANEAANGAAHLAQGASEQSASADEVGRTMSDFHQTISQIATGAADSAAEVQEASQLLADVVSSMEAMASRAAAFAAGSTESAQSARRGADVVGSTIAGMDRIRTSVGQAAQELQDLSRLSAQITEITDTISGIADQTSLLALNAAIEAARAGEHGKGFAVVADEVRKLAERSSHSARSITELIGRIQGQTGRAVTAMESGTAEVDQGSRLAADAGAALSQIMAVAETAVRDMQGITALTEEVRSRARGVVEAFNSVAAVTEENTAATEELAAGTEQVNAAVQRIAGIAQESAAATEEVSSSIDSLTSSAAEMAATAEELKEIATSLQSGVARFRL